MTTRAPSAGTPTSTRGWRVQAVAKLCRSFAESVRVTGAGAWSASVQTTVPPVTVRQSTTTHRAKSRMYDLVSRKRPGAGTPANRTAAGRPKRPRGPPAHAGGPLGCVKRRDYCTGLTVALAVNGSVGSAAVVLCQIVLPALTANARVPVVPNACGPAVA